MTSVSKNVLDCATVMRFMRMRTGGHLERQLGKEAS